MEPNDWTMIMAFDGERFPFVEDENANLTGLGHQDRATFAAAANRYELECGGEELPEDDQWSEDQIDHAWVTLDPDGELLHPAIEGAPGSFAVTGLWNHR